MSNKPLTWENVFLFDRFGEITTDNVLWLRDDDIVNRLNFLQEHFFDSEFEEKAFKLRTCLLDVARIKNLHVEKRKNTRDSG